MADARSLLQEATDTAMGVTPSVIAIANITGVKPKEFAEMLVNDDRNSGYLTNLVAELVKALSDKNKDSKPVSK